jgi:hypothetical protein
MSKDPQERCGGSGLREINEFAKEPCSGCPDCSAPTRTEEKCDGSGILGPECCGKMVAGDCCGDPVPEQCPGCSRCRPDWTDGTCDSCLKADVRVRTFSGGETFCADCITAAETEEAKAKPAPTEGEEPSCDRCDDSFGEVGCEHCNPGGHSATPEPEGDDWMPVTLGRTAPGACPFVIDNPKDATEYENAEYVWAAPSIPLGDRRDCHDFVDISNGTTLVNVSKCRRCGTISPYAKGRTTRADFKAAREAELPSIPMEQGSGEGLVEAAQFALREIDAMFDYFLKSGLVENGGGLPLYEQGKSLADARVKLAEALASPPIEQGEDR